ncbi:Uncharacterised protein [Mycobacterium tuberculosis]|nr:Uncharacterised protein [Mycobacterium tuberculosis]
MVVEATVTGPLVHRRTTGNRRGQPALTGQQAGVGTPLVVRALCGIQRGDERLRMHQRDQARHMAEPEAGQHAGLEWELAAEPQRVTHPHEMRGAGQLVVDAVEAAVGWDHPIPQYLAEPHHLEDRRAALGVAGQALLRHHEQRGALGTARGVGEPFMQLGLVGIVGQRRGVVLGDDRHVVGGHAQLGQRPRQR